jgi:hypothetical protein
MPVNIIDCMNVLFSRIKEYVSKPNYEVKPVIWLPVRMNSREWDPRKVLSGWVVGSSLFVLPATLQRLVKIILSGNIRARCWVAQLQRLTRQWFQGNVFYMVINRIRGFESRLNDFWHIGFQFIFLEFGVIDKPKFGSKLNTLKLIGMFVVYWRKQWRREFDCSRIERNPRFECFEICLGWHWII